MTEPSSTDPVTPETESGSSRKILIAVVALLLVVLAAAFIVSRSGLDKALVRQQLDAFSTSLTESARKNGRDVHFTYADIAIRGSFSGRHAVVLGPQVTIKPLPGPNGPVKPDDEMQIRTESFNIYARAVDLSALRLSFDKPIDFFDGATAGKKLMTISSASPFTADIALEKQDGRSFLTINEQIPDAIDVNYLRVQQAQGEEEATPTLVPVYETLHITQQSGGSMKLALAQDGSGLGSSSLDLHHIVLTPEVQPEGKIQIDEIVNDWSNTLDAQQQHHIHLAGHLGDVNGPAELLPYAPISVTLAADYDGVTAPQTAADAAAAQAAETSSFKLSKFTIATKESTLDAKADFSAAANDVLPVGNATITLSNVPFVVGELRQYGFLNAENLPLVQDFVLLVTGSRLDELKDTQVDVNRARGGSFTIGKTTFEELFAVVLKHSVAQHLNQPQPSVVPRPLSTPPLAPSQKIHVDEGARG